MAQLIDGKLISKQIKDELKEEAAQLKEQGIVPCLAVIQVGHDPASTVYVNNKKKACEYVGMSFLHLSFDESVNEEKVIKKIKELNKDKYINGIIVQLPLPKKFNEDRIVNTVDINKDVDGFRSGSVFVPPVAYGVMEIFDYYKINLEGKNVVVIGRSKAVGIPMVRECLKRNATVTICHSKTENLKQYTKNADILIVAVGKKNIISKSMIKKDAIIIDVGINRVNKKICGDVNPNVMEKCSHLTPVPGGVGPMTVVMLVKNTFKAYKKQNGIIDMFDVMNNE